MCGFVWLIFKSLRQKRLHDFHVSGPVPAHPAVKGLVTCLRAGGRHGLCSCTMCTVTLTWKIQGWEEPILPGPWRDIHPRTKEAEQTRNFGARTLSSVSLVVSSESLWSGVCKDILYNYLLFSGEHARFMSGSPGSSPVCATWRCSGDTD